MFNILIIITFLFLRLFIVYHSVLPSLISFNSLAVLSCFSLLGVRRCEDGCRPLTPWSTCVSTHSLTLTFSMNGDMPHVPITTLAGIASLTDCEWNSAVFQKHCESFFCWLPLKCQAETFCLNRCEFAATEALSRCFAWFQATVFGSACFSSYLVFSTSHYSIVLFFWSQCWTSFPSPPHSRPPPLRASYTMGGLRRKLPACWVVEMRIWPPS